MMFFDPRGNSIQCGQWLRSYEPYYFLNGPTLGRRINGRNQSSRFVENQVCALLTQVPRLSRQDLSLAMAWKIGGIVDHRRSEADQEIIYRQELWLQTLSAKNQFGILDFSESIPLLAREMDTILNQIQQGNPQYVFDLTHRLNAFGNVYILTALFFISKGKYPIYDKFSHIAAQAIHQDLPPGSYVRYRGLQKWGDYLQYLALLDSIHSGCPQQSEDRSMSIPRREDRSLWSYGHFFKSDL